MKACSYIRVSSRGQLDEGGPDRQRDAIAAYCARYGLELAGEYLEAISGTKDAFDRPGFTRMLSDCREQNIGAVIVERLDRLARDLLVQELLLKELRAQNLKLYTADSSALVDVASDEDIDPGRKALRQIMGVFAEYEKSMIVRRLRLGRERVGRFGGLVRFGEFDEREKTTLDYLLAIAAEEPKHSYHELARMLNRAGLRNRKGKQWTGQQIYPLLKRIRRDADNKA